MKQHHVLSVFYKYRYVVNFWKGLQNNYWKNNHSPFQSSFSRIYKRHFSISLIQAHDEGLHSLTHPGTRRGRPHMPHTCQIAGQQTMPAFKMKQISHYAWQFHMTKPHFCSLPWGNIVLQKIITTTQHWTKLVHISRTFNLAQIELWKSENQCHFSLIKILPWTIKLFILSYRIMFQAVILITGIKSSK